MTISDKYMKIIEEVTKIMEPHNIYVTGGFCRDSILGNKPNDIDFSTPATPDEIEECIRNSLNQEGHNRRVNSVGKKFGCLKCRVFGEDVDIVSFRTEQYEPGNRKPKVEYVKTISEDLSRRDFSINSMAIRLTKGHIRIIDNFGGMEDLEEGIIRAVGHPKQRFKEDPLRILRAIRFACRFDFEIEEKTFKKMQRMSINILNISKERWMMELDQILLSNNVGRGLELLWVCGLFKYMIPELHLQYQYEQNSQYHDFTLSEHTIKVVEATPKDINLRWGSLLHDIAKPVVRTDKLVSDKDIRKFVLEPGIKTNYVGHEILGAEMVEKLATHLKWSNERRKSVVLLVRNHLRDDSPLREYDNMGKIKSSTNIE